MILPITIASVLVTQSITTTIRRAALRHRKSFRSARREMSDIAIIGAGAWGTGLAIVLDAKARTVCACGA